LNPSPLNITKYSQPLKLVFFHIIKVNIKCHKGSHYLYLLNNYLFNYLNFSGLTTVIQTQPHSAIFFLTNNIEAPQEQTLGLMNCLSNNSSICFFSSSNSRGDIL